MGGSGDTAPLILNLGYEKLKVVTSISGHGLLGCDGV